MYKQALKTTPMMSKTTISNIISACLDIINVCFSENKHCKYDEAYNSFCCYTLGSSSTDSQHTHATAVLTVMVSLPLAIEKSPASPPLIIALYTRGFALGFCRWTWQENREVLLRYTDSKTHSYFIQVLKDRYFDLDKYFF